MTHALFVFIRALFFKINLNKTNDLKDLYYHLSFKSLASFASFSSFLLAI